MTDSRRERRTGVNRRPQRRTLGHAALVAAALVALAACTQPASESPPAPTSASPGTRAPAAQSDTASVTFSPAMAGRKVIPGEPLTVESRGGRFTSVSVTADDGRTLDGSLSADGTSWTSSLATDYATTYALKARIKSSDDSTATRTSTFTTLSKQKTFVGEYYPDKGATVGVAMPVSIVFNKPVHDKAAVERGLKVTAAPAVEGAWSWMKDRNGKDRIDYRPEKYWAPGTKVTLEMDLVGVNAGGGLYGIQNRKVGFTVGASVISTVDVVKKTMTVAENGRAIRTLPVSTGKKGFETWNGTMVVLSKVPTIRMNSASVGIFGPEAYDLGEVKWDVQLTPSGTYIHAAPWNEGKFGRVNGSHGCIGMSTADAKWFFGKVKVGDPVAVVNSKDTVATNNGYGDWNIGWKTWQQGSALG
ncbi:L,D-transpeptidase [Streptomyces sp. MI02-7b]|uniref:L,D-transpeptidase n=1 Tax=Streptomyces sp. MI02-7b TaxID=462941 RepID=UPI0029A03C49|nr:Ig-like domain-containing protein [Streptomyces sp. MI02-7b]MDX3076724.1 Ig-like domain-containing protein [Streptomyces sp. MI02-7b]